MPIRCLIIDDEPLASELVASYCARVPQLEVLGTCSSAVEASRILRQQSVDLLFLDIKMPQMLVESRREYAQLYLVNGKSLLVRESISSLEEKLNHHRFVRIHRSFLVTADKVTSFNASQVRIGEHILPIGRLYKNNIQRIRIKPGK